MLGCEQGISCPAAHAGIAAAAAVANARSTAHANHQPDLCTSWTFLWGPGQTLLCLTSLQWGATVYSHRKSVDNHVMVAVLAGEQPMAADVTDDRLAILIPSGPGGAAVCSDRRRGGLHAAARVPQQQLSTAAGMHPAQLA